MIKIILFSCLLMAIAPTINANEITYKKESPIFTFNRSSKGQLVTYTRIKGFYEGKYYYLASGANSKGFCELFHPDNVLQSESYNDSAFKKYQRLKLNPYGIPHVKTRKKYDYTREIVCRVENSDWTPEKNITYKYFENEFATAYRFTGFYKFTVFHEIYYNSSIKKKNGKNKYFAAKERLKKKSNGDNLQYSLAASKRLCQKLSGKNDFIYVTHNYVNSQYQHMAISVSEKDPEKFIWAWTPYGIKTLVCVGDAK